MSAGIFFFSDIIRFRHNTSLFNKTHILLCRDLVLALRPGGVFYPKSLLEVEAAVPLKPSSTMFFASCCPLEAAAPEAAALREIARSLPRLPGFPP